MNELIKANEWKKFVIAAILFFLVFIWLELMPLFSATSSHEYGGKTIEKEAAEQTAIQFVEKQTGYTVSDAKTIHQANKLFIGYLSKEKLTESYDKQYDRLFPNDYFQVNFKLAERKGSGLVNIHMFSGQIVGWEFYVGSTQQTVDEQLQKEAISVELAKYQFTQDQINSLKPLPNGEWSSPAPVIKIGEANMNINAMAKQIGDKIVVTKYSSPFSPPPGYKNYVAKQDSLAGLLTGFGYIGMSIALFILAIIYAVFYRRYTSFKYGSILTFIFLIVYIIMNVNMLDAVMASQGTAMPSSGIKIFTIVVTLVLSIAMAASVYISIVAGDGLWKAQGRNLWPRLGQAGYGQYVWRSMGLSYLFAIIMLGLQPVIFLLLEKVIGTWSTTDVSMSPYNMNALWLMPVLAWAAAISEEAVFRFFGIGIFRRWFKNSFLAALLPTLFWALGHVTYPFYPATTRLIELMIIGLLFSFIFVRYGFITAMFTHAIFNTVAVSSSLFMTGTADNIVSAIFFLALPVIIAYVLKIWDRRKASGAPIPNNYT